MDIKSNCNLVTGQSITILQLKKLFPCHQSRLSRPTNNPECPGELVEGIMMNRVIVPNSNYYTCDFHILCYLLHSWEGVALVYSRNGFSVVLTNLMNRLKSLLKVILKITIHPYCTSITYHIHRSRNDLCFTALAMFQTQEYCKDPLGSM